MQNQRTLDAFLNGEIKIGSFHYSEALCLTYIELNGHKKHERDYQGLDFYLGKDGFFLRCVNEEIEIRKKEVLMEFQHNNITEKLIREITMTEKPDEIPIEIQVSDKDSSEFLELYEKYKKCPSLWDKIDMFCGLAKILSDEEIKAIYVRPFCNYFGKYVKNSLNGKKIQLDYFMYDILLFRRDNPFTMIVGNEMV